MSMDKSWMKEPRSSNQYLNGLERFLDFAFSHAATPGGKIVCPCVQCVNCLQQDRDVVREHLVCKGMISGYSVWGFHGEDFRTGDAPPPIDFYQTTHTKKNGQIDDDAMAILAKCNDLMVQKASSQANGDNESSSNAMDLEDEVLLEVRGPKHPGRVRGAGMGSIPLAVFGSKRHPTLHDIQRLKAELENRKKRDAEWRAELKALKETVKLLMSRVNNQNSKLMEGRSSPRGQKVNQLLGAKCNDLMVQRVSSQASGDNESSSNAIDLEDEVLRGVRGPEHPPLTVFGSEWHATSHDVQLLEAELENMKKRDAEMDCELKALKEMVELYMRRDN